MYRTGEGVLKDATEAARWYRLAADQGDAKAQINLGLMYAFGYGVLKDDVLAHMWANIGSANGNENDAKLREFVEKRDDAGTSRRSNSTGKSLHGLELSGL